MTRKYCGDEYDWDVELQLKDEEVPSLCLGQQGELGWTSWLGERRSEGGTAPVILASQGF